MVLAWSAYNPNQVLPLLGMQLLVLSLCGRHCGAIERLVAIDEAAFCVTPNLNPNPDQVAFCVTAELLLTVGGGSRGCQ